MAQNRCPCPKCPFEALPIWKQHIWKRGFPKRNLHLLMLFVNDVPKNSISLGSWAPATFSHLFLFCTIFLLILRLPGRERGCQGIYACVHQLLPQSTYIWMYCIVTHVCILYNTCINVLLHSVQSSNGCGHSLCKEQLSLPHQWQAVFSFLGRQNLCIAER